MTWFLINPKDKKGSRPMAKKRKKSKPRAKARKKAPSAKQLAARRRFAAMARSRAAAARTSQGGAVAKRKKRRAVKRGPMRSVRSASGKTVQRATWRASGFRRNPKRRSGKRRSYRRNPGLVRGLLGGVMDLGVQAGAALVGGAVGGKAAAMLPFTDAPGSKLPVIDFGKNFILALLVKRYGTRFLPTHIVNAAALGMVLAPTKRLITAAVPEAAGYLGDVTMLPSFPGFQGYAPAYGLNGYSSNGMANGFESTAEVVDEGLGGYSEGW